MPNPRAVVAIVVGLGYAWVASDVRTFTRPAEVLTGLPILVVGVVLLRRPRGSPGVDDKRPVRWLAGWAVLELAWFTWEMHELFSSPRHDFPTLSSIGDDLLHSSRGAHTVAFALWLVVGAILIRARRSPRLS